MRYFKLRVLAILALAAAIPTAASALPPARAAMLTKAAASYYSLNRLGFTGLRCEVKLDWSVLMGQPRDKPELQSAFTLLDSLRFMATIDAKGDVKIDKKDTGTGRTPQQTASIQQIFDGLDMALTGLFQTWSVFAIKPPVPLPTQPGLAVADQPGGYRLTYKEGEERVVMDTNLSGEITHLDRFSTDAVSRLEPQFAHETGGLILNHFVGDSVPASGPGKTHLVVDLTYQTVGGLRVLSTVKFEGVYDGAPYKVALAFTGCLATPK
jgi:hypothetical protein